jgi:hypothetical protein
MFHHPYLQSKVHLFSPIETEECYRYQSPKFIVRNMAGEEYIEKSSSFRWPTTMPDDNDSFLSLVLI